MIGEQNPSHSDCRCAPFWQQPKPNGTCGTCGGWLPGERPKPLPWTQPAETRYPALSGRERQEAIRESNQRAAGDPYGG